MVYAVLFVHWVADFILQTDKMAKGKSKEMKWLAAHIAAYTAPFMLFGWRYAIINGGTHFIIDYFTSRLSSYMWSKQRVHDFFVVIGFDQMLHAMILVWTLPMADPIWS